MVTEPFSTPLKDSVAKVNDEIQVGENLDFQRKWWRFENVVWIFFGLIIVLDLAGLFGRGPIAKAERHASDGTINIKYERIQRTDSPSKLEIELGPSAIQDGKVNLYVSQSLVRGLGTERVVPNPLATAIGNGGLTYTFPASKVPAYVDLALAPSGPGVYDFTIGVVGAAPIHAQVFVVP
jgi:hypothetical protein